MGRRSGRVASEEEIKKEKAIKTSVFADVNKQINYMKTDHISSEEKFSSDVKVRGFNLSIV